MSETEALLQAVGQMAQQVNEGMQQWADIAFPGWRERVESAGYQGRRCGWYPKRPPRRSRLL